MQHNSFSSIFSTIPYVLGSFIFSLQAHAGSGPTTLPNPVPSGFDYYYGTSVALTPDGSIAVVGANAGGDGIDTPPEVYVFQHANGAWGASPLISLCDPAAVAGCTIDPEPADLFGSALSVSAINSNSFTIVVGSPGGGVVNGGAVPYGVVYIYQCTVSPANCGTPIAQIGDPATSPSASDNFGSAVAISQDGNTVLVGAWGTQAPGAPGSTVNQANEGMAYEINDIGGSYLLTINLYNPSPTCGSFDQQNVCDEFGYAVALAGSGPNWTALIGAPGAVELNNGQPEPGEGQAFIFSLGTGTETLLASVVDPNTAACGDAVYLMCDEFGHAVALSGDASEAMISAPNAIVATAANGETGAVSVMIQSTPGSWSGGSSFGCPFTNANQNLNTIYLGIGGFGWSLALSNDGSTLTIGMPEGAEGTNNGGYGGTGEVDIFTSLNEQNCSNIPANVLVDPNLAQNPGPPPPADYFGAVLAMSGDASVTLVGAPDTTGPSPDTSGNNGLAYVYGAPGQQPTVQLTMNVSGPNNTTVNVGQNLTYTLTITNTSQSESATNVTLTGTLVAGVTLISDSTGGATCTGTSSSYTCTLTSLGSGATWTPSVTVEISSADAGQTVVAASANVKADNSSNNPSISASVSVAATNSASNLSVAYQPFDLAFANEGIGNAPPPCTSNSQTSACLCSQYEPPICSFPPPPSELCSNVPGSGCLMIVGVANNSTSQTDDNVTLTVTAPPGTTISNPQLPGGGTCSVSGSELSCGLATLSPQVGWIVAFNLNVNSTAANGQSETSVATASASNTSSANNSFQFRVGTPTVGGGGIDWLELTVLGGLIALVWRRKHKYVIGYQNSRRALRLVLSNETGPAKQTNHFFEGTRGLPLRTIAVSIAILSSVGCALTLKPSPPAGSVGLASPVTIGVTSNTEIVNTGGNGPAVTLPASVNGNAYTLSCNAAGSVCTLSQALPTGAYTLNVTALVTWPAFYSVPAPANPPVTCNVPGNGSTITQCYSLMISSTFDVGCAGGSLTVVSNTTLIPVPAGKPTSYQLNAQGGCPPYTWTVSNPTSLPPGITISSSGLVTGTETAACTPDPWTYDNSITVTDSLKDTGQSPMTFSIC